MLINFFIIHFVLYTFNNFSEYIILDILLFGGYMETLKLGSVRTYGRAFTKYFEKNWFLSL